MFAVQRREEIAEVLNAAAGVFPLPMSEKLVGILVAGPVFAIGPVIVTALVEAQLRGWQEVRPSAALMVVAAISLASVVAYVLGFNGTRLEISSSGLQRAAGWPAESWAIRAEDIAGLRTEYFRGRWVLIVQPFGSKPRRVALPNGAVDKMIDSLERRAS